MSKKAVQILSAFQLTGIIVILLAFGIFVLISSGLFDS